MKYTKNLILLAFLLFILTGCQNWFGWNGWNFWSNTTETADEFVTDNDSVFDLFEDGDEIDSDFDLDSDNDFDVSVDAGPPVSTTVDPAYDEIAKMTPDELRALGILKIPVLLLGGNEFPFPDKQFGAIRGIDKCDHLHYHGVSGYSIDLKDIPEPASECGFDNNVTQRTVTGQQMVDWFHSRPRNF